MKEQKTEQIRLRLTKSQKEEIKKRADREGLNMSSYISHEIFGSKHKIDKLEAIEALFDTDFFLGIDYNYNMGHSLEGYEKELAELVLNIRRIIKQ